MKRTTAALDAAYALSMGVAAWRRRRQLDDLAASHVLEVRQCRAAQPDRAHQIDLDGSLPLYPVEFSRGRWTGNAGVVDDDVQSAEFTSARSTSPVASRTWETSAVWR